MKLHSSCSGFMNIRTSLDMLRKTLKGHLAICCYDPLLGWNHIVESKLLS